MIGINRSVITSKKSTASGQQTAAYSSIKAILIKAYPEALSMDDLVTATGHQWKRAEIFLATNYGAQINELLRDATYHPARYKINPDLMEALPDDTEMAGKRAKEKAAALDRHVGGQLMVAVVHKKKKTLEMPLKEPANLAKKPRKTGVFKDIVTCLIQSDAALTADEILKRSGIQSSKAVLMSVLSDRLAKKQLARHEGCKPYRYFVPATLKERYIARFGIEEVQFIPPKPTLAMPDRRPVASTASSVNQAVVLDRSAAICLDFNVAVTLRGQLTLTINGQEITLMPDCTRQLAKMIRHMAD